MCVEENILLSVLMHMCVFRFGFTTFFCVFPVSVVSLSEADVYGAVQTEGTGDSGDR